MYVGFGLRVVRLVCCCLYTAAVNFSSGTSPVNPTSLSSSTSKISISLSEFSVIVDGAGNLNCSAGAGSVGSVVGFVILSRLFGLFS